MRTSLLLRLPAALLALGALSALGAPAPASTTTRRIDLDQPGAIERVQRDNPAHYGVIRRILAEAPVMRPRAITGWIRTAYDAKARDVLLVKTSHPPRARLEFALGDTRYVTFVTLRNVEPSILPAG